jgi:hypothetical protein
MSLFRKEFLSPRRDGFYQEPVPSVDLSAEVSLQSGDPWVVIGAVLQRLKHGDFNELDRLLRLLKNSDSAVVWAGCSEILGHAAPHSLLHRFLDEFRDELMQEPNEGVRAEACEFLCSAMMIEAVPAILSLYEATKTEDSQIRIQLVLSFLLEQENGFIYNGPEEEQKDYPNGGKSRQLYIDQVSQAYQELRQSLGVSPGKVPVLEGRPFSVRTFAERFLGRLRQGEPLYRVSRSRMMLEANTGIDCRQFYVEDRLQPQKASGIVERFLKSRELQRFENRTRYFFGNVVPE